MIITKQGQIIRIDSGQIRQAGRSTQGVRLVNVEAGGQVAAASLIPEADAVAPNGRICRCAVNYEGSEYCGARLVTVSGSRKHLTRSAARGCSENADAGSDGIRKS